MAKTAKKTPAKRVEPPKPERKVKKVDTTSNAKEFRKNLDLDYETARYVRHTKSSVSFYVTDNNSGNEVLVCENIDHLDKVHEGLREILDL